MDDKNSAKKSSIELKEFDELLGNSWDIFTRMWKRLLGAYLMLYFSIFAVGFLFAILIGLGWYVFKIFHITGALPMALLFICMVVFFIVMAAAAILVSIVLIRAIKDREHPIPLMQSMQDSIKDIVPYYKVGILSGAIVLLGYMLFIIPGIIWGIRYMFAGYEYIYRGTRGFTALQTSKAYVKGRWWKIFWLSALPGLLLLVASFILEMIANAGPDSGILSGIIVTLRLCLNIIGTPLLLIYSVLLFENVKDTYTGGDVVLTSKQKNRYILGIVCGILFVIALVGFGMYSMLTLVRNETIQEQKFQSQPTSPFDTFPTVPYIQSAPSDYLK